MKRKLSYYGTELPSANISDFPDIDMFLRDFKVDYDIFYFSTGERAYRINKKEAKKLPKYKDSEGRIRPYLPIKHRGINHDGHGIYPVGEDYPFRGWNDKNVIKVTIRWSIYG